jgi:hemerythrin
MGIQWDASFETGIDDIDRQHCSIVEHLTALSEHLQNGFDQDQLKKMAGFLQNYIKEHFATEEAYMQRYNYPKLQEQQTEHQQFAAEVENFAKKMENSGGSRELAVAMLGKMVRWVINHLRNHDGEMGVYVKAQMQKEAR